MSVQNNVKQEEKCVQKAMRMPLQGGPADGGDPRSLGRKPTKVFRHGACSACIFFNPVVRQGEKVEMASVSFAKLYRKHGELKKTSSLHEGDLAAAILVLGQAYEWLRQLEEETQGVMSDGY